MSQLDVAVIGGGPAGLTAAGTLARQLHTAVVFDSGQYRNSGSHHMHTVPGWEHEDPAKFRKTTREQIENLYGTIQFADVGVKSIKRAADGGSFSIVDANEKIWEVKKVILAVGSTDVLPEIEGYRELWKNKIYHCLFCRGYEDRGAEASGILAVQMLANIPGLSIHMADNAAQLSKSVTIFTNGSESVAAQAKTAAANAPFNIEPRGIARLALDANDQVRIDFVDGTSTTVAFLVHSPLTAPSGPFVQSLGLELGPTGDIKADAPFFQTNVRGVFAAGDCASMFKVVPNAIMNGNFAAVACATQLQAEKYGHASMV